MKLFISIIVLAPIIISSFNFNEKYQKIAPRELVIDSIPYSPFYGLTAHEITRLPIKEIKELCATKEITLSQFIIMRTKAKNYLLKEKIRHDSIETARIYEEVDELLDIDN